MALILNIETSSENCSVALARDGEVLVLKEESSDKYIHSEKLHVFISDLLASQKINPKDLEAVAVGAGPGSYTGLRIGVSAAKGFSYALNIPLIAILSPDILVADLLSSEAEKADIIIPMIDARRMEVYCAIYTGEGTRISAIEAKVIEESSFNHIEANSIQFIGSGANKCTDVLTSDRMVFSEPLYPSAKAMSQLAEKKFTAGQFEDTAYFEPYYLKNFIAGKPKKLL